MKFLSSALALVLLLPTTAFAADPTIAAGNVANFEIDSAGVAFGWGYNGGGQLGTRSSGISKTPTFVMAGMRTISVGYSHTLYLDVNGDAYGSGYGGLGALGIGISGIIEGYFDTPQKSLGGVTAIAAGGWHSLFLRTDGSVWSCGSDSSGQLGLNHPAEAQIVPVKVMTGIRAIATGLAHSLFLKTDGSVWGAGSNTLGQLGTDVFPGTPVPVRIMDQVKAISANFNRSLFLKTDGSVWATTNNNFEPTAPVLVMTGVKAIATGPDTSFFIKTNGDLWAMGRNDYGQLGDGTTIERGTPVQVLAGVAEVSGALNHSMARKTDGSVWTTGENSQYYPGLGDNTLANRSSFAKITVFRPGTYDTWRGKQFTTVQNGNAAHSSPTATPFGDGVPNQLKFFLNIQAGAPMTAADRAALPAARIENTGGTSYLTLTYRRSGMAGGLVARLQEFGGLSPSWGNLTPDITTTTYDPATGDQAVVMKVATSGLDQRIVRLAVSSTPAYPE